MGGFSAVPYARLELLPTDTMPWERLEILLRKTAHDGLLAGSSGFGPAWRVDGGKIVSLTA